MLDIKKLKNQLGLVRNVIKMQVLSSLTWLKCVGSALTREESKFENKEKLSKVYK